MTKLQCTEGVVMGDKQLARIQRKLTKGWRMPPNTVYVGHPTKWGNPFDWRDADSDVIPETVAKRYAKELFEKWLLEQEFFWPGKENLEERRQWILDNIDQLRGKNLADWCAVGEPCHVDVLIRLANEGEDNGQR